MSLIGTLSEIKLADVLRLFAAGKKTGVLAVSAPGQEARFRLEKGGVVNAAAGRLQGEDAVLDVFGWTTGQLTFVPGGPAVAANVSRPVDELIEEGERRGAVLHRMNELIPSDSVSFRIAVPKGEATCTVGATAWQVLRFVDAVRDVGEIVEASGLARTEVALVLLELAEAGFLEKASLEKRLRVQGPRAFASFSLLAPDPRAGDTVELDEQIAAEWRKTPRFSRGVVRVEMRTVGYKKSATSTLVSRAGLGRDILVPRPLLHELEVREGGELLVRPVA